MIDFRERPAGFDPGIYEMPFSRYRMIPALNSSKLKQLRKTPAHFKAALPQDAQPPTAQLQRSFDKGSAYDTLILHGPDALKARVAIEPQMNRNKKEYKEWKEQALFFNRLILSQHELDQILEMGKAVRQKKAFSRLFASGHPHRVVIWQDRATGIWCKAELDWITSDGIVVDLKTSSDAGYWFFARQARRLGYVNQGAFYLEGLSTVTGVFHDDFRLAAAEVDPPYESHVFRPSQAQLMDARDENSERMGTLYQCLETNNWPGYLDEVIDLDTGQYDQLEGGHR
jgi:hypothetical protein